MSREIKFRGMVDGRFWTATPESSAWEQFWSLADKETIGQYTGLTDTNGTEIYEDDICKVNNWRYGTYQIQWHSGGWCVYSDRSWKRIGPSLTGDCFKVIGNKFENPELLEVESCGSK